MSEETKKDPTCEELIESHQESRMDLIFPDFDTFKNCFDYWCMYNNSNENEFLKEITGMSKDILLWEYYDEVEAEVGESLTDEEKESSLLRNKDEFDSDFDEWIWENYQSGIELFMNEFHQEKLSELPLAISKTVQYRIELSYGGPQDYICLDWDPEGKCWTGGSYHYLDWYDGARRTFSYELAEQIAEAFCIYPSEE